MATFAGTGAADHADAAAGTLIGFTGGSLAELQDASGDIFSGLDGNDFFNGGAGNDAYMGGAGSDVFKTGKGHDVITDFRSRYFTALMSGADEVFPPGSSSPASATASLLLNRAQTLLTLSLASNLLDFDAAQTPGDPNDDVNGFHIHAGAFGMEGGIVWDIASDANTVINAALGTATSMWSSAEGLTGNLAGLFSDGLYLNIHTVQFGGGAIRGQIDEVGTGSADRIDLTALNIGSFATWQAITADVAGIAKMTTFAGGVASCLTISGIAEAMFTAADFIFAGAATQLRTGTALADDLFGAGGNDTLNGLGGADRLFGENGNDKLLGLGGNDLMDGGAGFDTITGGLGRDTMTGGAQRDIFDFNSIGDSGKTRLDARRDPRFQSRAGRRHRPFDCRRRDRSGQSEVRLHRPRRLHGR